MQPARRLEWLMRVRPHLLHNHLLLDAIAETPIRPFYDTKDWAEIGLQQQLLDSLIAVSAHKLNAEARCLVVDDKVGYMSA